MKRKAWLVIAALIISILVALCIGRYTIGPLEVTGILLTSLGLESYAVPVTAEMQMVFWNIRLPRVIMSLVVGSGIAMAGVAIQSVFRNPLAAPEFVGVMHGAGFGAALAILFFTPTAIVTQSSAFAFAMLAVTIAYILSAKSSDKSITVLIICGIVVSVLFEAGLAILEYIADPYDQLAKIVFWIMGSFHTASWAKVQSTLPLVISGIILLSIFSWRLNILTLNEEEALSLGINIFRWRVFFLFVSTVIVAASIAAVGSIRWVGLTVPHIARYLVGTEHKRLVPMAAVLGGIFMLLMDTLARSVAALEIPISIVTSIFGAPFLGYLIINRKRGVFAK